MFKNKETLVIIIILFMMFTFVVTRYCLVKVFETEIHVNRGLAG